MHNSIRTHALRWIGSQLESCQVWADLSCSARTLLCHMEVPALVVRIYPCAPGRAVSMHGSPNLIKALPFLPCPFPQPSKSLKTASSPLPTSFLVGGLVPGRSLGRPGPGTSLLPETVEPVTTPQANAALQDTLSYPWPCPELTKLPAPLLGS